jgi:hypothetical protein
MIAWITARLGKLLAGLALALSLLASSYMVGRKNAKDALKIEGLEDYRNTRERIDEVDRSPDADAAFERLRRNGWLR